jgi:hypothetical protein
MFDQIQASWGHNVCIRCQHCVQPTWQKYAEGQLLLISHTARTAATLHV